MMHLCNKNNITKNLVDFINESFYNVNEAISIPKKFDEPFELGELDLTDEEIKRVGNN